MKQLGLVFTIVFATVAMASVTLDSTAVYAVQGQRSNVADDSKPLPLEESRTFHLETDEASWISLDVSPDGEWIVFDVLGDLYLLPFSGGEAQRITSGMEFDSYPPRPVRPGRGCAGFLPPVHPK